VVGGRLTVAAHETRGGGLLVDGSLSLAAPSHALLERQAAELLRPLERFGRARPAAAVSSGASVLFLIGGVLWGILLLQLGGWALPALSGRREPGAAAGRSLLGASLALATLRIALFLAAAAPLCLLVDRVVPGPLTRALVLPAFGLLGVFLFLVAVRRLAGQLDAAWVIGPATPANPWHRTLQRYYAGHARRAGLEAMPARVLLLPGRVEGVVSYGGGLAPLRVLVGESLLHAALGELPDETGERTVDLDRLPLGLLSPRLSPARVASAARVASGTATGSRGFVPRVLGEKVTLLGCLVPDPGVLGGAGPPAVSSREIVLDKSTLAAHYAPFEEQGDEEELEPGNPAELDFLFGALARELGPVPRSGAPLQTLGHALGVLPRFGKVWDRLERILAILLQPWQRPWTGLADASVALERALPSLVQYLHVLKGGTLPEGVALTARADMPALERVTRAILGRLGRAPAGFPLRPTPEHRLSWLQQRFFPALAPAPPKWPRRVGLGLLSLFLLGLALREVRAAVAYHPIYVDRMRPSPAAARGNDARP
jgi:hypothetical protein